MSKADEMFKDLEYLYIGKRKGEKKIEKNI